MQNILFTPGIDDKIIRRLERISLSMLALMFPLFMINNSPITIYLFFAVGIILQIMLMLRFKQIGKLNIYLKNKAGALLVSLIAVIYLIAF